MIQSEFLQQEYAVQTFETPGFKTAKAEILYEKNSMCQPVRQQPVMHACEDLEFNQVYEVQSFEIETVKMEHVEFTHGCSGYEHFTGQCC